MHIVSIDLWEINGYDIVTKPIENEELEKVLKQVGLLL
jgi:hypothetical protein